MIDVEAKAGIMALFTEATGVVNMKRSFHNDNVDNTIIARKRFLGLSAAEYLEYIKKDQEEFALFCKLVTITATWWLRDVVIWDHLGRALRARLQENPEVIRLWSAGCSKGPEVYSAAIIANEVVARKHARRFTVLATDYLQENVDATRLGRYSKKDIEPKFRDELVQRYFARDRSTVLRVKDCLKDNVTVAQFNLIKDSWSDIPCSLFESSRRFDFIFCRNVMFYFSAEHRRQVLDKLVDHLLPKGYLYIGDSDDKSLGHPSLNLVPDTEKLVWRKGE
jgi:chemotaxis protein methyltransferase CheR